MTIRSLLLVAVYALATMISMPGTGLAQKASQKASQQKAAPNAAVTEPDLRRYPSREWLTNGGDWNNTRYSTLTRIDRANVKNLRAGAKAIVVETTAPAAATMPASMHPEGGMKR